MNEVNQRLNALMQELNSESAKANFDANKLLQLSSEIAKLDQDNVRFSVDAGIINRLGKELVGRHETAVSELVKNAYDADAKEVNLFFTDAYGQGGSLMVEDDGVGMTRDQLINGFMRLSSADKIHFPLSPRYKRVRAGRKGIGRFATQRLGSKLTIITQTSDGSHALKIKIDWDKFESDIDLLSVTNSIEVVDKQKVEGTLLIIENLRDAWTDAMIKRVYRYTVSLLQPFPLSKVRKVEESNRIDPGFITSYFRKEGSSLRKIIDQEEAFFKQALAEIEGYVLTDGQGCWSLKSKKLNFKEEVFHIGKSRDDQFSKFDYIRDIHFKCYYFIYRPDLLSPQLMSFIREVANEYGGIRLYRNGFRVLPYAEKGNDWLRLDESSRRRVILTSHSNNNFFGFVEITDKAGVIYEETSSREGLIENEAFEELVDFVQRSIINATIKVAELRGTKSSTSQREWKHDNNASTEVDEAIDFIKEIVGEEEKLHSLSNEPSAIKESGERIKVAVQRLVESREKEKIKREELIEEINMLRVLAGLGLVIGEFVHEVKRFLPGFHTDAEFLKRAVIENPIAYERASRLGTNIIAFTSYTSYFDRTISQNVLRELQPVELRDVVNSFYDVIEKDALRSNIQMVPPVFDGFDLFTVPMHRSEWASILFNFYTNSKKAIRRKGNDGEIFIHCGRNNGSVFLEFWDNGDGIPEQNRDKIFDAFFTTNSVSGLNSSDVTGMGLGLKIVRDIILSYGGSIVVMSDHSKFKTGMKILIPSNE